MAGAPANAPPAREHPPTPTRAEFWRPRTLGNTNSLSAKSWYAPSSQQDCNCYSSDMRQFLLTMLAAVLAGLGQYMLLGNLILYTPFVAALIPVVAVAIAWVVCSATDFVAWLEPDEREIRRRVSSDPPFKREAMRDEIRGQRQKKPHLGKLTITPDKPWIERAKNGEVIAVSLRNVLSFELSPRPPWLANTTMDVLIWIYNHQPILPRRILRYEALAQLSNWLGVYIVPED